MVSKRQSRVWGINRICSVCYQSFLARNPLAKRCDECRKDDFFDDNTEFIEPVSIENSDKQDNDDDLLYQQAEESLLSRFRLTAANRRSLRNLGDTIRKEVWD